MNELEFAQALARAGEPRTAVEFTEGELRKLLEKHGKDPLDFGDGDSAYFKMRQALEIETSPGGKFS